ncbi:MAG: RICIN domain-containing protein [Micromonosporaceae bacterium]
MAKTVRKWFVGTVAGLMLTGIAVMATPGAAHAASVNIFGFIRNYDSGKCVQMNGTGYYQIVQQTCNWDWGGRQSWSIYELLGQSGSGKHWIEQNGECLEAHPYDDSVPVYTDECNINSVRQVWRFVYQGNGVYLIRNNHTDRCLYVKRGSLANGAYIGTAHCLNSVYRHYKWRLYK